MYFKSDPYNLLFEKEVLKNGKLGSILDDMVLKKNFLYYLPDMLWPIICMILLNIIGAFFKFNFLYISVDVIEKMDKGLFISSVLVVEVTFLSLMLVFYTLICSDLILNIFRNLKIFIFLLVAFILITIFVCLTVTVTNDKVDVYTYYYSFIYQSVFIQMIYFCYSMHYISKFKVYYKNFRKLIEKNTYISMYNEIKKIFKEKIESATNEDEKKRFQKVFDDILPLEKVQENYSKYEENGYFLFGKRSRN